MFLLSAPPVWFVPAWLILAALVLVTWLVIYPYSQRKSPLTQFVAERPQQRTVKWQSLGGVRYPLSQGGTMTVTMPLARVTQDDDGISVMPSVRLVSFAVPTWKFKWSDLAAAQAIGSSGVKLRLKAMNAPVVLRLMGSREELLQELERRGVRVEHS